MLKGISSLGLPSILIGGITRQNVRKLIEKGFNKIAVIRSICMADNPYMATKELKDILST